MNGGLEIGEARGLYRRGRGYPHQEQGKSPLIWVLGCDMIKEVISHLRKEQPMAKDTHVYGEVDNKTDLKEVFSQIRQDVEHAKSRSDLTELYKRAGYLITLT